MQIRDFARVESLQFIDFLEALGMVADMKHLPLASDLDAAGINILQWAVAKATGAHYGPAACVNDLRCFLTIFISKRVARQCCNAPL